MKLNQETQQVNKLRSKISVFVLLGVFVTGLITSLTTSLPFYFSTSKNLEQLTYLSLERQVAVLNHLLGKHQDLAQQFTSRTEIKRRLNSYHQGELSKQELISYTQPRLQDAMRLSNNLVGMQRLTANQEVFINLGNTPSTDSLNDWLHRASKRQSQPSYCFRNLDGQVRLVVVANIFNGEQELIGQDLLFFETDQLLNGLKNEVLSDTSKVYLVNKRTQEALSLVDEELNLDPLPEALKANFKASLNNQLPNNGTGEQVVFYLPLEFDNWGLLIQQTAKEFYAPVTQQLVWPLLVLLLMVVSVGYVLNSLLRPLTYHLAYQAKELKISTAELRLTASVFEGTREAIAVTDEEMNLVKVNGAFSHITGFSSQEIMGRNLFNMFFQAKGVENLINRIQTELVKKASWQGEIWYFNNEGKFLPVLQTISAQLDTQGEVSHYIHIFNDISENKAVENKVNYLAHYDQLTDLPNRRLINKRLKKAIDKSNQKGTNLAILFMDLDHFKEVNDQLGHAAGDQLLQAVTQRLTSLIRVEDTLGRLGGDEFLLILAPETNKKDAASVAEKIINALCQPFIIEKESITIGVSIGIALCPEDSRTAEDLVKYADRAMYLAKDSGRNTYKYYAQTL